MPLPQGEGENQHPIQHRTRSVPLPPGEGEGHQRAHSSHSPITHPNTMPTPTIIKTLATHRENRLSASSRPPGTAAHSCRTSLHVPLSGLPGRSPRTGHPRDSPQSHQHIIDRLTNGSPESSTSATSITRKNCRWAKNATSQRTGARRIYPLHG